MRFAPKKLVAPLELAAACVLAASLGNAEAGTQVEMNTSMGRIVIELENEKAPVTSANFLVYVREGFYSGVVFHRVIPSFVIQAGGFVAGLQPRIIPGFTPDPIANKSDNGLRNLRYTLSMASTSDPNSATSQFFINLSDNVSLDYRQNGQPGNGYAVFARITEGQQVVDNIAAVATATRGYYQDVPEEDVVIRSARVIP